jgi:hypothetical protein
LIDLGWKQYPHERIKLKELRENLKQLKSEKYQGGKRQEQEMVVMDNELLVDVMNNIKESVIQGVGKSCIEGFEFDDSPDFGNGFYPALVLQLERMRPQFLLGVVQAGDKAPHEVLRTWGMGKHLEGINAAWQGEEEIQALSSYMDCIIAIIDTREVYRGFGCYFMGDDGSHKKSYEPTDIPNRPVLRLAYTGEKFFSIQCHPNLTTGAIRDGCGQGNVARWSSSSENSRASRNSSKVEKGSRLSSLRSRLSVSNVMTESGTIIAPVTSTPDPEQSTLCGVEGEKEDICV